MTVYPRRRKTDRGWRRFVRENAYRDVWLLMVTIFALAAIVIGAHENNHRIDDIQRERARALTLVCENTNRDHAGIVAFIKASIPRDRLNTLRTRVYLERARQAFPQTDCAAVVNRIVVKP